MIKIYTAIVLITMICFGSCKSTSKNANTELPSLAAPVSFQRILSKTPTNQKVLIDVRTLDEYRNGHIEYAINIDYYGNDFEEKIKELDTTKVIFIYCKKGGRSASVHRAMREVGIPKICELDGGFNAWEKEHLPIVQPSK